MLTILEAVILGIVQGFTEWLPISSSGHLVIIQRFLGVSVTILFDVALHLGSVLVIIVVFRKEIVRMLKGLKNFDANKEENRITLMIVVGSIPTAIIGFTFLRIFESVYFNLLVIGIAFLGTGFTLYFSKFSANKRELSYVDAVFIGIAQGVAILPGASRSGLTISTGLLRNVKWELTARYSFLLAIPAILGATLAEIRDITLLQTDLMPILVGVAVTIVIGYISLKALLKIIAKGRFHLFSYYCWTMGLVAILTSVILL